MKRADVDPSIPRGRAARLALLRSGLIPWLAGIDPDSKTPRRNIASRSDIPVEAAPLIDLLVEERLLSADTRVTRDPKTGEGTRESTIEPTHEALLRQWGLLAGWLKEDFGLLTTLEGIKRAARDWDANARGDAWLTHQVQRLAEAQALDARPDIAAWLDPTDRGYLAGCRAREEAARAEAEQRRREREAEQARRLVDARKIVRRTAIGAAAALVLAIAAGAFGWYALSEKSVADQKTAEAISQKNVADSATTAAVAQKALADLKADEAIKEQNRADAQAREALAQKSLADSATAKAVQNQSVAFTVLAATEAQRDQVKAIKLALSSWPRNGDDKATPKLLETLDVLSRIVPNMSEPRVLLGAKGFAAFSPDGTRIIAASEDDSASVWEAASGRVIATLKGHESEVTFAAFSPDGNRVVTGSKDGTTRVWNVASGLETAALDDEGLITSAAFSPDGTRIVTASWAGTARLWDPASGREIARLKAFEAPLTSAAFSRDGKRIVTASDYKTAWLTASDGKTAWLWDAASGRMIAALGAQDGRGVALRGVALSLDGTRLVGATDSGVWIWDAASGREIAKLNIVGVSSAALSPDGTRLVTTSMDDTTRVWDAATAGESGEHRLSVD
jgi:hypothetical protein